MATANAIAAVGQAILSLIAGAVPKDEFGSSRFDLYQAKDFQSPMEEGISLYLYRITPSGEIRNYPPRVSANGRRYRQALPINLHYLLSSWARDAAKQQRLLGWAMRILEDTPILPPSVLNQGGPETDTFRPNETVDLVMESVSIYDMGAIWDVAKPNTQPSVCYVARMVGVESQIEIPTGAPVQTRVFNAGEVVLP